MTLKKSICLIILLSYPVLMFAQNNLKERNLKTNEVKSMKSNNLPAFTFDRTINREEAALISEMNRIRNSGIPGSGEKLTELQKKIEKINNYSVTLSEHDNIQTPVIGENASANIDQRSLNEIYSGTYVKGIATQVEQNYSGAGTIWAAIGVGATDTGVAAEEDTLIVYRSLDNSGTSFSMFARIPIGSGNKFYPEDAIDMEIIELNNLTTYVYIVYSYTTNGYTGNQKAGCTVIRDNPALINNFTLNFPGSSYSGNNYFRPRITSDIATYPVSPYVTITVTQDSASGIDDHWYLTKYCRIVNPFTTIPAISYIANSIFIPLTSHPKDVTFTVQTDIAYINSGSGISNKIIFILSGYPGDESKFYVYKTDATVTGYPFSSNGYFFFLNPDDFRESFRVASNSGPGQNLIAIIFSQNKGNTGDLDEFMLSSFVSDSGDIFNLTAINTDHRSSRYGDVIGRRKSYGIFNFAYSNETGCSWRNYAYGTIDYYNSNIKNINSLNGDYETSFAYPKPAFRYESNDSSLALFSSYNKLFSKAGNSAPLTLSLKINVQGLYNNTNDLNNYDTEISAYLANPSAPYEIIDSSVNYLCSNNNSGFYTFNNALEGNYFIVLKHKNMLETWSAAPISLYKNEVVYLDLRYNMASVYGSNLINVNTSPVRYAAYSGDVNRDGIIDLTDIILIYNDAGSFITGNTATDLTGEQLVDLNDVLIAYNNSINFVSIKKP